MVVEGQARRGGRRRRRRRGRAGRGIRRRRDRRRGRPARRGRANGHGGHQRPRARASGDGCRRHAVTRGTRWLLDHSCRSESVARSSAGLGHRGPREPRRACRCRAARAWSAARRRDRGSARTHALRAAAAGESCLRRPRPPATAPTRLEIGCFTTRMRSNPAIRTRSSSPGRTGCAAFARSPLTRTCPARHAVVAAERVLYTRTAQSHASTRAESSVTRHPPRGSAASTAACRRSAMMTPAAISPCPRQYVSMTSGLVQSGIASGMKRRNARIVSDARKNAPPAATSGWQRDAATAVPAEHEPVDRDRRPAAPPRSGHRTSRQADPPQAVDDRPLRHALHRDDAPEDPDVAEVREAEEQQHHRHGRVRREEGPRSVADPRQRDRGRTAACRRFPSANRVRPRTRRRPGPA